MEGQPAMNKRFAVASSDLIKARLAILEQIKVCQEKIDQSAKLNIDNHFYINKVQELVQLHNNLNYLYLDVV